MGLIAPDALRAEYAAQVVVVGAGAAGLTAALAARAAGVGVLVVERDRVPSGSTSLSSGFVPAAGTRFQRAIGVEDDSPALFAADILAKAKHEADPVAVACVARAIGPALEWLNEAHGIPFAVLEGFRYPGHGRLRMHAVPERTGAGLQARLLAAAEAAGADIVTQAKAVALAAGDDGRVAGVRLERPDGGTEDVGCGALVLACNGYGGAPDLVRRFIPALAEAIYFGHAGNDGSALRWGWGLGAAAADLGACQGHGSVAHPHGVLITWALMTEGGIQVNLEGRRFWNEHEGYSEAAEAVLAQPEGVAFVVYDRRLHELAMSFPDYRTALEAGAVRMGDDAGAMAEACGLPADSLAATLAEVQALADVKGTDRFGRCFAQPRLEPPFCAVRVTGALFHTQGGLVVDTQARVLRPDGTRLPNLFAAGGAARGVSGAHLAGYLSGNGLLTAIAYGRIAGAEAARLAAA